MNKVVVIYSGGLDSTVLLAQCKLDYDFVIALNFDYGSKHNQVEREAAKVICKRLAIPLYLYDLPALLHGEYDKEGLYHLPGNLLVSSLLKSGGEIPIEEHNTENMKSTVVPFRNGIMLALAAGFAESRGYDTIVIANHSGDWEIYPDCRTSFIESCREAIWRGTGGKVHLLAPFINLTKVEIVKLGKELGAPLDLTWSCYCPTDENKPCGKCSACIERNKVL